MRGSFSTVTEIAGEKISKPQLKRQVERYRWALEFCRDRVVLDLACGTASGLGMVHRVARTVVAADIDMANLAIAHRTFGNRLSFAALDAQALPFRDSIFDVILLFEAIYYLEDPAGFVDECRRVLRQGGTVLIATANKDLYDFTPSPFSFSYFGAPELERLFGRAGFVCNFFAGSPVAAAGLLYRLLRPAKAVASQWGVVPGTMAGKRWLKRLVFGSLVAMPAELRGNEAAYDAPVEIGAERDTRHHVLYCVATKKT